MKPHLFVRALGVALSLVLSQAVKADPKDFEFSLVETSIKQGDATIAVRLVDKRSGKPVPDAVIFATRLDMAPDGMEMMTTKIEPAHTMEPGIYRFKAKLTMEGGWRLSLGAKVQGETGTIESKLTLKVVQ